MEQANQKFKLHRIFEGKDEIIGSFKVKDGSIIFSTKVDEHHCDMFPPGPIASYTRNKIAHLLNNKSKSMYLEQVE